MDAHVFRMFCRYLVPVLQGARVEKIQQPAADHLVLSFYGSGKKRNLCLRYGKSAPFMFLSDLRPQGMQKPFAQIMRIRKYFADRHIGAIVAQPWQRKIWLMAATDKQPAFDAKPMNTAWLCLDMVSGATLHFFEAGETPEEEIALWPDLGNWPMENVDWRAWPVLTPALRRTLALMPVEEQRALLADLEEGSGDLFVYKDSSGSVRQVSAWPLMEIESGLAEEAREDIVAALEEAGRDLVLARIHDRQERDYRKIKNRELKHLRQILANIDRDGQRLRQMLLMEDKARLLIANLWRYDKNEKLSSIRVEDGGAEIEIALDRRQTLIENIERMFELGRKGRRGLAHVAERRDKIEREISGHDAQVKVQEQAGKKMALTPLVTGQRVQKFISSDGFILLRGRDARGNMAAWRQGAAHDIWAHVEGGPGAHVIIRRPHGASVVPESTLMEAGILAANKSWLNEASSANVMYAEKRHVKACRSGPPGKMIVDKVWQTRIVPIDHKLEEEMRKKA